MIYCNPVPIAAACYLAKDVVSDCIGAFVKAVNDLTKLGHSMRINLDFVTLNITNKSLSHKFQPAFESQLNQSGFEHRVISFLKVNRNEAFDLALGVNS